MAGGPIRTPTRGTNYVQTQGNNRNQSPLLDIPFHASIHSMLSHRNTLPHPHQGPIQGDKEIFHPVPNYHLASFSFDSILPPPLIIHLLPRGPVLRSQPITLLTPEDQVSPGFLLYPTQVAQWALSSDHPSPLPHIPLTPPQMSIPQEHSPVPSHHAPRSQTPLCPFCATHTFPGGSHPTVRYLRPE